jgi:general secretion pathway protein D
VKRHAIGITVLLLVGAFAFAGCAAGQAFRHGDQAVRVGDWDAAVQYYRRAVHENPGNADYRIALERAMVNASRYHLDRARSFEAADEIEAAIRGYHKASEYDPSNRQIAAKALALERSLRDRLEAARPKPQIEQLREEARRTSIEPVLNPASREPIDLKFTQASIKDILGTIATLTGINVTFDSTARPETAYTVDLQGVTLEQALNQILTANSLFYKVINERTILVSPDTPQKRQQYEEQVIRTFYVSNADVAELVQVLNGVVRMQQMAVIPTYIANKTSNTVTVRASASMMGIIERVIEANDKPRAEIVVDVEILEVNRNRARQIGLNLSDYSISGVYSPESDPGDAGSFVNLRTITGGVTAADFFLAVPSAVVRFLESDSETKLIAKPQLRGAEGEKLTLNLGDEIPVPTTVFTPFSAGGVNIVPTTSFSYRSVGVNLEIEPRVTYEGDIILRLMVESSTLGRDVNIAGQNLPTFGSRKVTTRLRLRDGESNLLAGLLREDERQSLTGFPGIIRLPLLRHLFSASDRNAAQTDIVMLLTPRIVRTHELTQQDVGPIYIGTQQSPGLGGPPPLIAPPQQQAEPPAAQPPGAVPGAPAGAQQPPVVAPPGVPTEPPVAAPPGVPPAAQPPGMEPTGAPSVLQAIINLPTSEMQVGAGPYAVPITLPAADQVSTLALTVTYDPAVVRVLSVQEGSFMRQGGTSTAFTQQIDPGAGRVDISVTRPADPTGASGAGVVVMLMFEAVAPGTSNLSVNGVGTSRTGASIPLAQASPVSVSVR